MLRTLWATVRQGRIELLESAELPEAARVLVAVLPDDEAEFWLQASHEDCIRIISARKATKYEADLLPYLKLGMVGRTACPKRRGI